MGSIRIVIVKVCHTPGIFRCGVNGQHRKEIKVSVMGEGNFEDDSRTAKGCGLFYDKVLKKYTPAPPEGEKGAQ